MESSRTSFLVYGSQEVGKTRLCKLLCNIPLDCDRYIPTIGAEIFFRRFHKGKFFSLSLWDISGQERMYPIVESFYD